MKIAKLIMGVMLLGSSQLVAQVKFDLQLLPDNETYVVSLRADQTWAAPKNMVANLQVVLRHNSDKLLSPAITSLVPGLTFTDNSQLQNPVGAPGKSFVCISMVEKSSSLLQFNDGVSIPLFAFTNQADQCVGNLELVSNNDADVFAVRANGLNITQNVSVLGAGGSAYTGNLNTVVSCATVNNNDPLLLEGFAQFEIFPNPARDVANISWINGLQTSDKIQISLHSLVGQEMAIRTIANPMGKNIQSFDVSTWPQGMYYLKLQIGDKMAAPAWNFQVIR